MRSLGPGQPMHQHVYSRAHAHPGEHLSECSERPPSAVRLYLCLQSRAEQGRSRWGFVGLASWSRSARVGKNNLPHRVLAVCSGVGRGLALLGRENSPLHRLIDHGPGGGAPRGRGGAASLCSGGKIPPFIASLIIGLGVGLWDGLVLIGWHARHARGGPMHHTRRTCGRRDEVPVRPPF